MSTKNDGFASTYNRGFQMRFENGMTISVQFSTGSYCDRRNFTTPVMAEMTEPIVTSPNAEIAIWDAGGNWFNFGYDEVKGFVTPDEVALWINSVSSAESLNDLQEIAENAGLVEKLLNQR